MESVCLTCVPCVCALCVSLACALRVPYVCARPLALSRTDAPPTPPPLPPPWNTSGAGEYNEDIANELEPPSPLFRLYTAAVMRRPRGRPFSIIAARGMRAAARAQAR